MPRIFSSPLSAPLLSRSHAPRATKTCVPPPLSGPTPASKMISVSVWGRPPSPVQDYMLLMPATPGRLSRRARDSGHWGDGHDEGCVASPPPLVVRGGGGRPGQAHAWGNLEAAWPHAALRRLVPERPRQSYQVGRHAIVVL